MNEVATFFTLWKAVDPIIKATIYKDNKGILRPYQIERKVFDGLVGGHQFFTLSWPINETYPDSQIVGVLTSTFREGVRRMIQKLKFVRQSL